MAINVEKAQGCSAHRKASRLVRRNRGFLHNAQKGIFHTSRVYCLRTICDNIYLNLLII